VRLRERPSPGFEVGAAGRSSARRRPGVSALGVRRALLASRARAAIALAKMRGEAFAIFVSPVSRDAPRLLLGGEEPALERALIAAPARDGRASWTLDARGLAAVVEARGHGRLAALRCSAGALFRAATPTPEAPAWALPRLVGGFAFEDDDRSWEGFGAARFVLPARLVVTSGREARIVVATRVTAGEEAAAVEGRLAALLEGRPLDGPDPRAPREVAEEARRTFDDASGRDSWRERVRAALSAIERGDLEKVVLARTRAARLRSRLSVAEAVRRLRIAEPRATAFAISPAGTAALFLGATPERLLRLEGPVADTDALAGTAPRDADPARDAELSRGLRTSEKEEREHALVADAITSALRPIAAQVEVGPRRERLLSRVRHLATRVSARLREPAHILDVAGRLHPTPAVSGAPRDAARRYLAQENRPGRGWYAGAVGWCDARGDGELLVAIRSALVRGRDATLFAGAGIVRGSDALAEYAETEAKLAALAQALGAEAPPHGAPDRTPALTGDAAVGRRRARRPRQEVHS